MQKPNRGKREGTLVFGSWPDDANPLQIEAKKK